eukprot:1195917-Prorocentrum_minimum.AAC.2
MSVPEPTSNVLLYHPQRKGERRFIERKRTKRRSFPFSYTFVPRLFKCADVLLQKRNLDVLGQNVSILHQLHPRARPGPRPLPVGTHPVFQYFGDTNAPVVSSQGCAGKVIVVSAFRVFSLREREGCDTNGGAFNNGRDGILAGGGSLLGHVV